MFQVISYKLKIDRGNPVLFHDIRLTCEVDLTIDKLMRDNRLMELVKGPVFQNYEEAKRYLTDKRN